MSNQILKQGARLKITGFKDQVETIERTDIKEVYDITTKNHEFVANGIVVHNCPQEAFISTANSPFSVDALQSYEPKAVIDSEDGWQIWKKPSGYSIMAIDSAEGLNNHDRSVIDIYDEHLEQVAQWAGWCDTDELADKAVLMGERYKSFIITEINNMGIATQGVLSKKYPKNMQYHREVFDKDSKTKVDRIGWRTGNLTRGRLVGDLATAVREHDIIFNSPETIDECLTFVKRNGKFQAEEGCNDDRVITAGLAVQGFIDRPPSKYILNPELKAEHEAEQVNAKWRQNKIKKAKIKRLRALRSS